LRFMQRLYCDVQLRLEHAPNLSVPRWGQSTYLEAVGLCFFVFALFRSLHGQSQAALKATVVKATDLHMEPKT
jgi:hypothetical protein